MKRSKNSKNSAKITIIVIAAVIVACLVGVIVLTSNNGVISSDEALDIVIEDLGVASADSVSPHVHEGTYENQPCYNVYVTVDGKSLTYVVSTTGEILHKGEGGHSH